VRVLVVKDDRIWRGRRSRPADGEGAGMLAPSPCCSRGPQPGSRPASAVRSESQADVTHTAPAKTSAKRDTVSSGRSDPDARFGRRIGESAHVKGFGCRAVER
jgi:hypothetical protein